MQEVESAGAEQGHHASVRPVAEIEDRVAEGRIMKSSDFFTELEKDDPEFAQAWADATPARVMAGLIVRLRQMRQLTQSQLAEAAGMQRQCAMLNR